LGKESSKEKKNNQMNEIKQDMIKKFNSDDIQKQLQEEENKKKLELLKKKKGKKQSHKKEKIGPPNTFPA